ncbi:TPA: hypothetical protein ACGU4W_001087 [Vibrio vulnificus]|nr:hypothetical protein [Vibrio vulnificus]
MSTEYGIVIEIKKGLENLKRFRQHAKKFDAERERALKRQKAIIDGNEKALQKGANKTTQVLKREEAKRLKEAEKVAKAEERLRLQQQKQEAAFNKWKNTQFRSAAFARLSLEEKMNLKRILNSKKAEAEIRDEFQATTASYRREMAKRAKMDKKSSSVSVSKGAGAGAAGGALGGVAAGAALMSNPYIAGAAVLGGAGVMATVEGGKQFKELQQGSELLGVDVNTLNKFSQGVMASTDIDSISSVNEILKNLQDRSGEVFQETKFDRKTGEFKGGEGSIVANELMKRGVISNEDDLKKYFSVNGVELTNNLSRDLEGLDKNSLTFMLEAFGSDFSNIVAGLGTEAAKTAQANATQFNDSDMKDATLFMSELNKFTSSIASLPLDMFKEFTNSLSPEALKMFSSLGTIIKNLAVSFSELLAIVVNVLSVALTPLIQVLEVFTGGLKDMLTSISESVQILTTMIHVSFVQPLKDMFLSAIDSIKAALMKILPDWALPDDMKSSKQKDVSGSSTTTPVSSTTPATVPTIPYNMRSQSLPMTTQPYSYNGIQTMQSQQTNVTSNVNLIVDGKVLANTVVNQRGFTDGVNAEIEKSLR